MSQVKRKDEFFGFPIYGVLGGVCGCWLMWMADAPGWAVVGIGYVSAMLACLMRMVENANKPR